MKKAIFFSVAFCTKTNTKVYSLKPKEKEGG